MEASDIDLMLKLAREHNWVAIAAAVSWLLVRLSKDDRAVRWFPIEVSPYWRAWVAPIAGMVYGVVHKFATGGTWGEAIVGGIFAGNGATVGHELLIESLRRGRDIGVKKDPNEPPPPPPISIKPPTNVTITGACFLVALAVLGCNSAFAVAHCKQTATCLDESEIVALNATACREKLLQAIALGGSCETKRARVVELVRTDADCIALYGDGGMTLECRATRDGGTP